MKMNRIGFGIWLTCGETRKIYAFSLNTQPQEASLLQVYTIHHYKSDRPRQIEIQLEADNHNVKEGF